MHRSLRPLGVALLVVVVAPASVTAGEGELPSHPLPGLYAKSLPPLDLRTGVLHPLVVEGPRQPPLARRALDRMTRTFDRPETFSALSVGYMTLNGLDWATTVRALNAGHREGNPVMASVASNPTALLLVKGASTAATLYLTSKLAARHPRAATGVLAALHVVLGIVVVRNATVERRGER